MSIRLVYHISICSKDVTLQWVFKNNISSKKNISVDIINIEFFVVPGRCPGMPTPGDATKDHVTQRIPFEIAGISFQATSWPNQSPEKPEIV